MNNDNNSINNDQIKVLNLQELTAVSGGQQSEWSVSSIDCGGLDTNEWSTSSLDCRIDDLVRA
ncbi:hypothetical protein [Pleionea sp. CnH1-48]|uniref:hypothetical protein n=1 Tax=Pleionea sp. CnH1-48 TaxID=2954494 RepID=UPI0020970225|nr:hypothetical protein [Pleionea sp. CnH1-48]MCO7226649.1 hypothetical protein [Pleionea sp. CnH1-48]